LRAAPRGQARPRVGSLGSAHWRACAAAVTSRTFHGPARRVAMPSVMVNGAELYHEVRGTGPPVLPIMGATGDGGHFDAFARVLADEFTVITYDRRGNGRSPVPADWRTTSPEEQADDAAGLLEVLGTGPAAIFSTSVRGELRLSLPLSQSR